MSHVTKAAGIKDFYDPAGTNRLVKDHSRKSGL